MIKKAIACLLIATLAMTMLATQFASSTVHHVSGHDYDYWVWAIYGLEPCYSECYHTTTPGASDNTEVGIGVKAIYGSYDYFDEAWWDFNAQFGEGDVALINGLSIDPCVNGDDHHYYTYYGSPSWDYINIFGYQYWCWRVHYEINPGGTPVSIGQKSSVEGSVTAFFYQPSDPPWPPYFGPMWELDAYTQNPPDDPYGNGWSYLTAWASYLP